MPRLLTYGLRSLWARRTTTLATAGGIGLMVFVLSASGMLATGMRQTLISAGSPGRALVMQQNRWSEQRSRLPQAVLGRVSAAPAVKRDAQGQPLVTGETVSHVMLASVVDANRISTIQVRGVMANVFSLRPSVRLVEGRAIRPGSAEAIIGRGVADRFEGLSIGGNIELAAGRPIAVVGVFESGRSAYESEVWVDLEAARSSLALEGSLSSVTAELEDPERLDAFAVPLTADKQTGVAVERESTYYTKISGGLADVIIVLGVAETVLFSFGAILGTMVVCYAAVVQRRHELGVLRALGFPRRSILAALLLESMALALAGSAAGIALALCTPLLDFNTENFATGQEVAFHFTLNPGALLVSVALAVLVGAAGGLVPALRAVRMDPVQAMRA